MNISELGLHLSGGTSNSDPLLSIGSGISTTRILDQLDDDDSIAGITIIDSVNNPVGAGSLDFTKTGNLLTWTASGETAGTAVDIGADGRYSIFSSGGGYLSIDVVFASLPATDLTSTPVITEAVNLVFDDISSAEAGAGMTDYRCVYLKNTSSSEQASVSKVWLNSDAVGADTITIGLGSSGLNGTEQLITNENTAPSAVSFTAPADYAGGLDIGTLTAGDYYPIWIKRVIPASTSTAEPNDNFVLGYGAELP